MWFFSPKNPYPALNIQTEKKIVGSKHDYIVV